MLGPDESQLPDAPLPVPDDARIGDADPLDDASLPQPDASSSSQSMPVTRNSDPSPSVSADASSSSQSSSSSSSVPQPTGHKAATHITQPSPPDEACAAHFEASLAAWVRRLLPLIGQFKLQLKQQLKLTGPGTMIQPVNAEDGSKSSGGELDVLDTKAAFNSLLEQIDQLLSPHPLVPNKVTDTGSKAAPGSKAPIGNTRSAAPHAKSETRVPIAASAAVVKPGIQRHTLSQPSRSTRLVLPCAEKTKPVPQPGNSATRFKPTLQRPPPQKNPAATEASGKPATSLVSNNNASSSSSSSSSSALPAQPRPHSAGYPACAQAVKDPQTMGKEIELGGFKLLGKSWTNGIILARTSKEALDIPLIKIEVEGVDRGLPAIEIVYGPLTAARYTSSHFLKTRRLLVSILLSSQKAVPKPVSKPSDEGSDKPAATSQNKPLPGKSFAEAIKRYNSDVGEKSPYHLLLNEEDCRYQNSGSGINIQTNVALPYVAIGHLKTTNDVDRLFEGEATKSLFGVARQKAQALYAAFPLDVPAPRLASLLTHLIYYDLMYGERELCKGCETKSAKMGFHVQFKFSPEDAVLGILWQYEVQALSTWLSSEKCIDFVRTVYTYGPPGRRRVYAAVAAVDSLLQLCRTTSLRLAHGPRVLDPVESDGSPYATPEHGFAISHTMPRPSNRIPIMRLDVPDGQHYVVFEQRSAGHRCNRVEQIEQEEAASLGGK